MPPKKRGATTRKAATTAKTTKRQTRSSRGGRATKRAKIEEEEPEEEQEEQEEEEEEEETTSTAATTEAEAPAEEATSSKSEIAKKLRAADAAKPTVKKHKPDTNIPNSSMYQVVDDYDAMLNQTNIGGNNNKYYVIQVLSAGGKFYTYTRWGRVGESGKDQMFGPFGTSDGAIIQFKSKFKDKTRNDWDNRSNFKKVSGKYDMIEVAGDDEEEDVASTTARAISDKEGNVYLPSKLDSATQALMRLIFDKDMFQNALKKFDIDVKKMPLGKLSKTQIAKGFETLEEIEHVVERTAKGSLQDLSSKFYTIIPHNFGRSRPPTINTIEAVQQKYDMLAILADIELAQSMQKDKDDVDAKKLESAKPHPYDTNYALLQCDLTLVDTTSEEFQIIKRYTENTQGYRKCKILDVWRVNRHGEDVGFAAHSKLQNRKLLWHGTNVAVVVAILKSGLRIMPHSGGRVGKGIYFASENGKSSGYVGVANDGSQNNIGIMFLNEVALGKEHSITADDSSLKKPPANFDSVVARGQTEPDPKGDTKIEIDKNEVIVPTGKPIPTTYKTSSFSQSEYLIYQENQCRIRYLLKMQF